MARPRKKNEDRRAHVMAIPLSNDEHTQIETMAKEAEQSLSAYARSAVMKPPAVTEQTEELPVELLAELNRIGVELNRMTKKLNATGQMPADVTPVLDQLNAVLDRIEEGKETQGGGE